MLQQVRKIVLFINTNQPLHGRSQWDPFARVPTSDDIDDMCGVHLRRCLRGGYHFRTTIGLTLATAHGLRNRQKDIYMRITTGLSPLPHLHHTGIELLSASAPQTVCGQVPLVLRRPCDPR